MKKLAMSRRGLLGLSAAGLAGLAAGCGVFPEVSKPVKLYTLTPKTTFPPDLPTVDWQLVVETPTAPAGIDSARIALQRSSYTLEYFADSGWTDRAPEMIQTLIVESMESTGKIVGVGMESIGIRPDYLLKTDVREFQAVYPEGSEIPYVYVRISVLLVRMPDRRIIASISPEQKVDAAGTGFTDIIDAYDDALGKVLRDIVVFALIKGQQDFV
jgi:cholesterol transport system auxiliary component